MSQSTSESIVVVDVPERSRYEITVNGTIAGFTEYVDRDARGDGGESGDRGVERVFPHTVIEEEFGGRGLSTVLIATALDAARVDNLAVIPECSAVQHFIAERPDYVDLVPASRRAEFDL
ncbi:MAG: GNAT family N-acetyltransferase [Nocardioides sp.]